MLSDYSSINAVFASIKTGPNIEGDRIDMTPHLLNSWFSSLRYSCYLVLGRQAILTLTASDWFPKCVDVTDITQEHLARGHWGQIFGVHILVPHVLQQRFHNLRDDCLYVISKDGQHGVSQLLLP